jgi:hypothetical protein
MSTMFHIIPEGELTPFAQAMPDEYVMMMQSKHTEPTTCPRWTAPVVSTTDILVHLIGGRWKHEHRRR